MERIDTKQKGKVQIEKMFQKMDLNVKEIEPIFHQVEIPGTNYSYYVQDPEQREKTLNDDKFQDIRYGMIRNSKNPMVKFNF